MSDASSGNPLRDEKDGKKRRVTQSCNVCRKKRIKCDGQEPVCGPCHSKGWECSWTAPKKRGPPPGKQIQAKMQKMEIHLYDLYTCLPGLQAISEMLLGLAVYDSGVATTPIQLQPPLSASLEDFQVKETVEERLEAFRNLPAGVFFADDTLSEEPEGSVAGGRRSIGPVQPMPSTGDSARKRTRLDSFGTWEHGNKTEDGGSTAGDLDALHFRTPGFPDSAPLPSSTTPKLPSMPSSAEPVPYQEDQNFQDVYNHVVMPPEPHGNMLSTSVSLQSALPTATDCVHRAIAKQFNWHKRNAATGARAYGPSSHFINISAPSLKANYKPSPRLSGALPATNQRAGLVHAYLTVIHPAFPMCSRQELLRWSYEPSPNFTGPSEPALLYAVLACATPYLPPLARAQSSSTPQFSASAFAEMSKTAIEPCLAHPSLTTVQVLALLSLHEWGQGNFTLAWLNLASAIALAIDLGLHLTREKDAASLEGQRLTWYSLLILDTSLSAQLGRVPLTPVSHAVPLPAISSSEEWELLRSETVEALEAIYPAFSGDTHPESNEDLRNGYRNPYSQIGPARTLSTFVLAINISEIARKGLAVLNASSPSPSDYKILEESRLALIGLAIEFSEFVTDDVSELAHVAQTKVDLFLHWLYLRLLIEQALSLPTASATAATAHRFLLHKLHTFTYYRTPVTATVVCFTLGSVSLPGTGQTRVCRKARSQVRQIFPQLVDEIEALSLYEFQNQPLAHSDPYVSHENLSSLDHEAGLPQTSSSYLPAFPTNDQSLESLLNAAASVFNGNGTKNSNTSPSGQSAISGHISHPSISDNGRPQSATFRNVQQPYHGAMAGQAASHEAGSATQQYSLPHQAMQSLADLFSTSEPSAGTFDTSRIFDSATWAQTDVLSSLGFMDPTPDPSHAPSPSEITTGMLDRWIHGDGSI